MLEIKDLTVVCEEKEILKSLNLKIQDGEIHVLMGPNGTGKSTVVKSILHHPNYQIKSGHIDFNGKEITNLKPSDIAKLGIYYISQSPIEIEGITNAELIRTSLLEQNEKVNIFEFQKNSQVICEKLNIPKTFLHREVNVGMSGGERKKNELLQMYFLQPKLVLLDEIDSGLDVDAVFLVAKFLKEYQKETNCAYLIVTHGQQLIDLLQPEYIHIMKDGKIVETGDVKLAKKIQNLGFSGANFVSEDSHNE